MLAATLPVLPDLDVVWSQALSLPSWDIWGHRGITHSLAFAAVTAGVATSAFFPARPLLSWPWCRLALFFFAVAVTHPLLDAMTWASNGVALWAPFDEARIFLPYLILPASPTGTDFVAVAGARVALQEIMLMAPVGTLMVLFWLVKEAALVQWSRIVARAGASSQARPERRAQEIR